MAVLQENPAINLTMPNFNAGWLFVYGTLVSATGSQARFNYDVDYTVTLTGSFSYDRGRTTLQSGTITSISETLDGVSRYTLTGLAFDVGTLMSLQRNTTGTYSALLAGNDEVTGSELGDVVWAYDGNDTMVGLAGDDHLDAGAGDNVVYGGDGNDDIVSGDGNDWLDGDAGNDHLMGNGGNDSMRGLDGNDVLVGGAGDDDVNGNTGNDTVNGNAGADLARGGQGNDIVSGDDGDDPHVNGNIGNDTVYGGTGNDLVFGGQDNDRLYGDAGNDTLSGDLGSDTLTGGTGADWFVLRANGGQDEIRDFSFSEGDRVHLEGGLNIVSVAASGTANTRIDFGQGTSIILDGIAPSSVAANWFA